MYLKGATVSGQDLTFGRLNIIVGPNNVGKSTLLRTLHETGITREAAPAYPGGMTLRHDDALDPATARVLLSMARESKLKQPPGGSDFVFPRQRSTDRGGSTHEIRIGHGTHDELTALANGGKGPIKSDPGQIRRLLWIHHSSATRVQDNLFYGPIANPAAPWPDALNAFRNDSKKFNRLQRQVLEDYGESLILLDHDDHHLQLGLAPADAAPPPGPGPNRQRRFLDTQSWISDADFVLLRDAGDGMKAKVRLLLSLFEPLDHILFIDEPELHLYQKQRRSLGQRLVELSETEAKQVFVVTHDATFLQGVLDGLKPTSDVRLVRMTRADGTSGRVFIQHSVSQSLLRARRRQEDGLSALFREGIIIVEGPTDRAFYEEARDLLGILPKADIGFIPAWGLDQMAGVAEYCKELQIPYQCIVDFDALLPQKSDSAKISKSKRQRSVAAPLDALAALANGLLLHSYRDLIRTAQTETAGHAELGSLKTHGLEAVGLNPETKAALGRVLAELRAIGIHVVPNGSVESWVRAAPRDGWVEAATNLLHENARLRKRIQPFMGGVIRAAARRAG